jgi:Abortive infection alpha
MGTPEEEGLEITKEAVKQAMAPVQKLLLGLLGPAATEIGLGLADSARLWRMRRAARFLNEVKAILDAAGVDVKSVPPRTLFPILDNASLEDDEELQRRWAILLSNAARTDFESEILSSFPDILRQLTPTEVQFLDRVEYEVAFDNSEREKNRHSRPVLGGRNCLRKETLDSASAVMLGNLQRLELLTIHTGTFDGDGTSNVFGATNYLHLSAFGKAFVRACRPVESAG